MQNVETMDPELTKDITREYLDVQKTEQAIHRLENKIMAEQDDMEKAEDYE